MTIFTCPKCGYERYGKTECAGCLRNQIDVAIGLLHNALVIDGSHHKQWFACKAMDALGRKTLGKYEQGISP